MPQKVYTEYVCVLGVCVVGGYSKKKFFLMFTFKRETECEWGKVRDRETQNLKQAPGSELLAQSPT